MASKRSAHFESIVSSLFESIHTSTCMTTSNDNDSHQRQSANKRKNVRKSETMKNYTRTVVDIIKKVIYIYIYANVLGKLNQDKVYVPKILSLFVMLLHYRSHFLVGVRAILLRQSGKQRGGVDDNCMLLLHLGNKPARLTLSLFHWWRLPLCVLCTRRQHTNVLHFDTYPNPVCFTLISRCHSLSFSPESHPCPICILWFADWQLLFGIRTFFFVFFNLNFRHKIIFKGWWWRRCRQVFVLLHKIIVLRLHFITNKLCVVHIFFGMLKFDAQQRNGRSNATLQMPSNTN